MEFGEDPIGYWRWILDGTVKVHSTARIDVKDFHAGPGTIINAHANIFGTKVHLGRECWIGEYALIGGGSAFDPCAFLVTGDWLHVGVASEINIARGVTIGSEVGIGGASKVFTHGAYLSEWDGYPVSFAPVTIGDRVWMPSGQINPGVTIGSDVVIASGSILNSEEFPSGSFIGGVPAKVLKHDYYPRKADKDAVKTIISSDLDMFGIDHDFIDTDGECTLVVRAKFGAEARFNLDAKEIQGESSHASETAKNQLRRRGIRFPYLISNGVYVKW